MKKLLIVGCGDGGIILANSLKHKDFEITILDPSTRHYFQPWLLHVALKGTEEKSIEKTKLLPSNVSLINKTVQSVDLAERKVFADGSEYSYDNIIIDTGSVGDYSKIPGHQQLYEQFGDFHSTTVAAKKMYSRLDAFRGGKIVVGIADPIYKCPPSPVEAAFLIEEFISRRHINGITEISFFTPYPRAYPAAPINEVVMPLLEKRKIKVSTFFDVDSVDASKKEIKSIEGDALQYDFAAMVPPHKGRGLVKDNCDDEGFVKTDKFTLNIGKYDDAFCIGDATNIPTAKSGVTAHLEAKVVSKRLNGIDARFDGRTNCPFETGYGQGTFVVGSYDAPVLKKKPNAINYWMKMGMGMLAWPALRGQLDIIFDTYFALTKPPKQKKQKQPVAPEKPQASDPTGSSE